MMTRRADVLDQLINAGRGEGLSAWRSLCRHFDPRFKTRFAGALLDLLNFESSWLVWRPLDRS